MIYTAGLMAEYERFGSATMGYMLLAEMDKQVKKMMLNNTFLLVPCAGYSTAAAALAISYCRRLQEIPATGDSERSVNFSGFLTVLL
jgi:hypothetical protein